MPRIIPAILTNEPEELKRLSELLAPHAKLIHFDVADGTLVPEKTVRDPKLFADLHLSAFGVHLLIDHPEKTVTDWVKAGATHVIVHAEAQGNIGLAIEMTKKYNRSAGLSINPETDIHKFEDLYSVISFVQLMSVSPGGQGRPFHENVFIKIAYIRAHYPKLTIAVDGGVNESNIARLARVGVEDLVVGSAIVKQVHPIEALKRLQAVLTDVQRT